MTFEMLVYTVLLNTGIVSYNVQFMYEYVYAPRFVRVYGYVVCTRTSADYDVLYCSVLIHTKLKLYTVFLSFLFPVLIYYFYVANIFAGPFFRCDRFVGEVWWFALKSHTLN